MLRCFWRLRRTQVLESILAFGVLRALSRSMMRCGFKLADTGVVTLRYARGRARVMALVPLGYPKVLGLD